MKKYFLAMSCVILTLAILFTTLYGCSKSNNETEEKQLGSEYQVQFSYEANVPEDAKSAYISATKDLYGGKYNIAAYLGSQNVNGTNYYFLCEITPVNENDAKIPVLEFVVVNCDIDGNCTISKQKEIDASIYNFIDDIK